MQRTSGRTFGAPLANLTAEDFSTPDYFYQTGRPPLRVDIMLSIPGVVFEDAWGRREMVVIFGEAVPFISKEDLIKAKTAGGRPRDLIDVANLSKAEMK